MTTPTDGQILGLGAVGLIGGLGLLARGFAGYRQAAQIGDTATSRISGLAVGEVRVTGTIEAAEVELTSPLQSRPCVYYRSTVLESEGRNTRRVFREERSVGFRIRDETGSLRVFPLGARWDVPNRFKDHDGMLSGPPPGLDLRTGPTIRMADAAGMPDRNPDVDPDADTGAGTGAAAQPDPGSSTDTLRAMQIADLLTVHADDASGGPVIGSGSRDRRYEEAALEVGDVVTLIGTVLPFDQLPDPTAADEDSAIGGMGGPGIDPEIAADLEAARAAGGLASDARSAWGNAAIPGFGIGRPVSAPTLDPAATVPTVDPETVAEAEVSAAKTFDIAPDTLVIAAGPGSPLLIAAGPPGASVQRGDRSFLIGLLGAVLSIGSATALGVALTGGPR